MANTFDRVDRTAALYGGAGGVAAYLLGYLLTYVWKASAVAEALRGINVIASLLGAEAIPAWKAVGWLFYNAHFVATRVPAPGGSAMVDFVARSDDGALVALYLLIPAFLLLAGFVAGRIGGTEDGIATGAVRGAAVAIGYFPLAVVGGSVFAHSIGNTGAKIAPDFVTAVLLAGLVYPLVFGAVGGAVAGRR